MKEQMIKHRGVCKKCNESWIYGFSFVAMIAQCPKCGDPIPIEVMDEAKPSETAPRTQQLAHEAPCTACL